MYESKQIPAFSKPQESSLFLHVMILALVIGFAYWVEYLPPLDQ